MTDAELFVMIRDLCVASTGSWSANQICQIAGLVGVRGRRASLISAITEACGKGAKRGGKRLAVTGTREHALTGTGTGTGVVSGTSTATGTREKEKEAKRKRDIYSPRDTSYLSGSLEAGPLFDVAAAFLDAEAERRGEGFTAAAARVAVSAIVRGSRKHGETWAIEALEKTIDRGAGIGYFNVIVRGTATGTGAPENGARATGTGSSKLQPVADVQQRLFEERQAARAERDRKAS